MKPNLEEARTYLDMAAEKRIEGETETATILAMLSIATSLLQIAEELSSNGTRDTMTGAIKIKVVGGGLD